MLWISENSSVKLQNFCDRPFTCWLKYFPAKFRKILSSGSLEISKFPIKTSKFPVSIFCLTVHVLHLTGFPRGDEKHTKCWIHHDMTFFTHWSNKCFYFTTNCVIFRRKIRLNPIHSVQNKNQCCISTMFVARALHCITTESEKRLLKLCSATLKVVMLLRFYDIIPLSITRISTNSCYRFCFRSLFNRWHCFY